MKNQAGRPSFNNGLLSIKSLWSRPPQPTASDVPPIGRTFSNESTIETNPSSDVIKRPPPSPTSVTQCDIFRPLRESFFGEEMENMLTLKRARPVCCGGSLLDIDEEEDDEDDEEATPVPLTRQEALLVTLDMLERDEDDDSLIGTSIIGLGERPTTKRKF